MSNIRTLPSSAFRGVLARRMAYLNSRPTPKPQKWAWPSKTTLRRWKKNPPYWYDGHYVHMSKDVNDRFHYLAYVEGEIKRPRSSQKKKC